MIRAEAIAIIVKKVETTSVFGNMQAHGLNTFCSLRDICFTLTSAMGLGGGQTPVIAIVYD